MDHLKIKIRGIYLEKVDNFGFFLSKILINIQLNAVTSSVMGNLIGAVSQAARCY
ncbi:hypothetical protein PET01_18950 [Pediococcus ethanolidurans]|nr:hypothetical protein PET01_18950 [Pediococcus ethanolidurans]